MWIVNPLHQPCSDTCSGIMLSVVHVLQILSVLCLHPLMWLVKINCTLCSMNNYNSPHCNYISMRKYVVVTNRQETCIHSPDTGILYQYSLIPRPRPVLLAVAVLQAAKSLGSRLVPTDRQMEIHIYGPTIITVV